MATNTTNYNLVKPAYTDTADIGDINGNMDIIDAQMKTNANGISSLGSSKSNLLSTANFSQSFTPVTQTTGNVTINVSRSGYTALGIVGITGSGTSPLSYSDFYMADSVNARIYYYNRSTSTASITLTVTVLYVKN